jgi:hypothetical protein
MTRQTTRTGNCPSAEELSAWLDGESAVGITASHIDSCPNCQAKLGFYRQVDQAISQASQPPADLASRISLHCHSQSARPRVLAFPSYRILRYAAAISFLGLLGILLIKSPFHRQTGETFALGEPAATSTAFPQLKFTTPVSRLSASPVSPFNQSPQPTQYVGATTAGSAPLTDSTPALHRDQTRLKNKIHHVWVMAPENCQPLKQALEQALPEGQWSSDQNSLSLQVDLADNRVQDLVDYLQANGGALLSPDLPQPLSARETIFTGQPTSYRMTMVQRK